MQKHFYILDNDGIKKKYVEVVEHYPGIARFREKENFYIWPCKMMEELGYDVEILALMKKKDMKKREVVDGIKIKRFSSTLSLLSYIRNNKDIALIHSFLRPNIPSLLSGILNKPAVITPLTYKLGSTWSVKLISLFFLKRFNKLIALTPHEKNVYLKHKVSSHKVVLLPFSVDYKFFSKKPPFNKNTFLKKYGIAKNDFVIISVANIRQFKNTDIIIKAFSLFNKQIKNSKLIIVGKDLLGNDFFKEQKKGKEPRSIKGIISELHMKKSVILTGSVNAQEIRKFLNICHLFVNSSDPEAQGIAVYEAAAAGLPLCLSRIGSFTTVFKDLALYNKPRDIKKLAENYLTYYKNKKLRKINSTNLRLLMKKWDYSVNRKKMETLFRSILNI